MDEARALFERDILRFNQDKSRERHLNELESRNIAACRQACKQTPNSQELDLGSPFQIHSVTVDFGSSKNSNFPCWIMVSAVEFPPGLEDALACSCEYTRLDVVQRSHSWTMPKGVPAIARYVRVNLEKEGLLVVHKFHVEGTGVIDQRLTVELGGIHRARLASLADKPPFEQPRKTHLLPPAWLPSPPVLAVTQSMDAHRTGQPMCTPARPKSYALERGVHHLQAVSLSDAWRVSWPRPHSAMSTLGALDQSGVEEESVLGPRGRIKGVQAVHADKGTTMLDRMCFQAEAVAVAVNDLLRVVAKRLESLEYIGKVKSLSKDKTIVELDRALFGPNKVDNIVGMLMDVGGQTRKVVSWNKLSYKATVSAPYARQWPNNRVRYRLYTPDFKVLWLGDRNGLEPVLTQEDRLLMVREAWDMIEMVAGSGVLEQQPDGVVPSGITVESFSVSGLRDVMELVESGDKWWKDGQKYSKYSVHAKFGPPQETATHVRRSASTANSMMIDPDDIDRLSSGTISASRTASMEDEREVSGFKGASLDRARNSVSRSASAAYEQDDGAFKGPTIDRTRSSEKQDEGPVAGVDLEGDKGMTRGEEERKGKSQSTLSLSGTEKKISSTRRQKEEAQDHLLLCATKGTITGLFLCILLKKTLKYIPLSDGLYDEISKTIMACTVVLKLSDALQGLKKARQDHNLLMHCMGKKIIRVPAMPVGPSLKF